MPEGVNVDVLTPNGSGFSGAGPVAQRLLQSGFNVNALRTQDLLRKDEWVQFDNRVVEIARHNLIGVADLMSRGLTYDVANAMGVTQLEWERMGDLGPAEISMAGVTEGRNDRMNFDLVRMPLPIVHKDFHLNIRVLEASRRNGQPLDTTQAGICARKVSEKIEQMLFLGNTELGPNNAVYGYTSSPNRLTGNVTADWRTATGAQMLTDVLAMIDEFLTINRFGPFVMYVPLAVHTHMGEDYKVESDKTIMQRLLEVPQLEAIRPSYYLTGSNIVMVQMSSDIVDMVNGIQPMVVQWDSHGGFVTNFKVLAIMVPRIKDTIQNQAGILHYTVA